MLIAVMLIIVGKGEQLRLPPTDEWIIKKVPHLHNRIYGIMKFPDKWRELETIILG